MREDFDKATVEMLSRVHHSEYIRFIHDLSKEVAIDGIARSLSLEGAKAPGTSFTGRDERPR